MWRVEYTLSQFFVLLALVCLAITYLVKDKKKILFLSILVSIFYSIQYAFLGAYTGMIVNIIGILRGIWFFINNEKNKKKEYISLITCSLIYLISSILTYQNIFDLIPLFSVLIYTYSVWQSSISFYRWSAIITSIGWIIHNIAYKSLFGTIGEVILLVIEVIGIVKLYRNKDLIKKTIN